MSHNLKGVALIAARIVAALNIEAHQKYVMTAKITGILTKSERYKDKCSCCGRPIWAMVSMKSGVGTKCASGKCDCHSRGR